MHSLTMGFSYHTKLYSGAVTGYVSYTRMEGRLQSHGTCQTGKPFNPLEREVWPTLYGVGLTIEEAIAYTLPWADYEMDYDAHYDFMEKIYIYKLLFHR